MIGAALTVGTLENSLGSEFKECGWVKWPEKTAKVVFRSGDEAVDANYLVITKTQVVAAQFLLDDENGPSRINKLAEMPAHLNFRTIKVKFGKDTIVISDDTEAEPLTLTIKEGKVEEPKQPDTAPSLNYKPALIFIIFILASGLLLHHFQLPPFAPKTLRH